METCCYPVKTPIGEIHIRVEKGIPVEIILLGCSTERRRKTSRPPEPLRLVIDALEGYFKGREPGKALVESMLKGLRLPTFSRMVLEEVTRIPRGSTLSYGEVAARVGLPGTARAVGNVMHANPYPIIIPCHRVIKGSGTLGGFGSGEHIKAWLLDFEGAPVKTTS